MSMTRSGIVVMATLLTANAFFLPNCLWDADSWEIEERNPPSHRYRRFLWDDSDVCDWMCDPDLLPHEICNNCCRRSASTPRPPVNKSPSPPLISGSPQMSFNQNSNAQSTSSLSSQTLKGMIPQQTVQPTSPLQVQVPIPQSSPLVQTELTGSQNGLKTQAFPVQSVYVPVPQNQNFPQPPQQNQNWPQPYQQNQIWLQPPQQNQNWPQPPVQSQNWPQPPQQNQNWPQPPQHNQNWPQPPQHNQNWPQPPQQNQNWPQPPQQNQNWPQPPLQSQNWPQFPQNWPQPPLQSQDVYNSEQIPSNQNSGRPNEPSNPSFTASVPLPINNEPLNVQVPINLTGLFQAQVPSHLTRIFQVSSPTQNGQNQGIPSSTGVPTQTQPQNNPTTGSVGSNGQIQSLQSSNNEAIPAQTPTPQNTPTNGTGDSGIVQGFINWMTQPFTQAENEQNIQPQNQLAGQITVPGQAQQQLLTNGQQQNPRGQAAQQFQTAGQETIQPFAQIPPQTLNQQESSAVQPNMAVNLNGNDQEES